MNAVLGGPGGRYSLFSTVVTVFVTTAVVGGGTAVVTTRVVGRWLFLQLAPMPTPRQIHMHMGINIGRKVQTMIAMTTPAIIPGTGERKMHRNSIKWKMVYAKTPFEYQMNKLTMG